MSLAKSKRLKHWIQRLSEFGADNYPLPGMPIKGRTLLLRPYRRSDEDARQAWAKYDDPYLTRYNFEPRGTQENDVTFQKLKNRIRIAVEDGSHDLIGYVSLKPMRHDPAAAELGICFAADQVSAGKGSEVLQFLIPWAVNTIDLERITLEVDLVNERAVRLYQRFGFTMQREYWHRENNPALLKYYKTNPGHPAVKVTNNSLHLLTWDMEWKSNESIE